MTILNIWLVFLGAGLGGVTRYSLGALLVQPGYLPFAVATLCANLLGAFIAGLLFALLGPMFLRSNPIGLCAMTGFLGGLTTFSAFTAEGVLLFLERPSLALVHAAVHVVGCFLMFIFASKLAGIFLTS